jgi:arabinose-5-phosphate isomerase
MNLAPTSSPTVTLALGDALAITLLTMRGFKEEHFAMRHPGGVLGKRLLMRVGDIMIREDLPLIRKDCSFKEALSVMSKGKQGVVIVVGGNGKFVGIFTDGDIRRTIEHYDRISEIKFEGIFTRNPRSIRENALAIEALKIMEENKITSLIVTDGDDEITGLLHIHHLLEHGLA